MEIYQTQDEQQVLKCELNLIKKAIDDGLLKGDLAEVGVMWGGSAKIIREDIPDKHLYLFDTFLGLPDTLIKGLDPDHYKAGDMTVDVERVKYFFKDYENTSIHIGIFPQETSDIIKDKKFSFVHIDTDIYQSTRDAMLFFWPKLEIQGSIIIHDYPAHRGVQEAMDELLDGCGTKDIAHYRDLKLNPVIESGMRQLIIRKRFDIPLNLEVKEKNKFNQVFLEDKEVEEIINENIRKQNKSKKSK